MSKAPPSRNRSQAYLDEGRLEDVLMLIQILGLAPEVTRSEDALRNVLLTKPQSAESWMAIAEVHSEFFRVYPGKEFPSASLAARRSLPAEDRRAFPPDFVKGLLDAAIALHETQ